MSYVLCLGAGRFCPPLWRNQHIYNCPEGANIPQRYIILRKFPQKILLHLYLIFTALMLNLHCTSILNLSKKLRHFCRNRNGSIA